MSFQWIDYLAVATRLKEISAESEIEEAFLRSAVSRAYYAALGAARNLLRDQWGIEVPNTAEIHSFIPDWFLQETEAERKELGFLLDRLRDRRRRADYDDTLRNTSALTQRTLADATLIIERLAKL